MPPRFARGNRDANEPQITEYLRRANVKYCLLPEGAGADLLLYTSPMVLVEIKNPKHAPSKKRLSDLEKETMLHCQAQNIPYYVVETPEDLATFINHFIGAQMWPPQTIGAPYV